MFNNKFKEKISTIDQLNKKVLSIKNKKYSILLKKTIIFSNSFYGKFNKKIKI